MKRWRIRVAQEYETEPMTADEALAIAEALELREEHGLKRTDGHSALAFIVAPLDGEQETGT